MTQRLLKSLILTGIAFMSIVLLEAAQQQPMSEIKIQQLDKQLTQKTAKRRDFQTKEDFQRHHRLYRDPIPRVHYTGVHSEFFYGIPRPHRIQFGRIHSQPKRGWILAYRYDRAAFFDRNGFYYGYFNRYGYYFEGIFYRYDRFYSYRDRLRGKGLFDRYFYRPANWKYYGFCR